MKPVLSSWPAKKRTTFFLPFAAGIFLLSFLILALSLQNFFLAILLPPIIGIAGAWALVGWPELKTKDGKPLVDPHTKPYLFFALAPLFAIILYPILGIAATEASLPNQNWLAIVLIVLSLTIGCAIAYWLVGFPNLYARAKARYEAIPPERRPFLFFPITVVLFLSIYLTLGVLSTKLIGQISPDDPTGYLNIQVLVLTPVCLALAALIAWLLVGIPKPDRSPKEYLPKVTGKHRPRVFFLTSFLGGLVLTLLIGALLTFYSALPPAAVFGLAILLGFALSVGISLVAWGTPARWRQYEDYTPGIHPRYRTPLLIVLSLATGLAIAIAIGLADIDLFWGLLAGALVAGIVLLFVTGAHRKILARRKEETLVPDIPDRLKALIFFGSWTIISVILFAVLTYALPGLVPLNALFAVLVGLAASFFTLEQPLLHDVLAERRAAREKRRAWEARRKERLAAELNDPGAGKPPEA